MPCRHGGVFISGEFLRGDLRRLLMSFQYRVRNYSSDESAAAFTPGNKMHLVESHVWLIGVGIFNRIRKVNINSD